MLRLFVLKTISLQVLIICFTLSSIKAQNTESKSDKKYEKRLGLSFFYHHQFASNLQPKEWNGFVSSYNRKTLPQEELTKFKNAFSFDAGIRIRYEKYFGYITYQHLHRKATATFLFNEQRIFSFYNNAICFGFGKNILELAKKKVTLGVSFGMRVGGDVVITSAYKYRDGFISYGSDRDLNGTYSGNITLGSEIGLLANIKLFKGLSLETSLAYQLNNNIASSNFIDLSDYKALNTGGLQVIVLPQDYQTYDPLNLGYYDEMKAKFNGYKLSIGISYEF